MSLLLINSQSVQQPLQLSAAYGQCRSGLYGPFEAPPLQPPVVKPKSIVIPPENFQLVSLSITKNEPLVREWIQFKYGTYESGQAIDRFPQIGCPGSQTYLLNGFRVQHRVPIVRSSSVRSVWSNPGLTTTVIRPIRKSIPDDSSSLIRTGIQPVSFAPLIFSSERLSFCRQ